jgi:hypothetical protein
MDETITAETVKGTCPSCLMMDELLVVKNEEPLIIGGLSSLIFPEALTMIWCFRVGPSPYPCSL